MFFNLTFIVLAILTLFFIYSGYQRGMARQLTSFVALMVSLCVVALCIMLFSSYDRGETTNVIYTVVLLVVLGSIYGIVKFLLKSLKSISNLPIVGFFDKVLGMLVGLVKAVLIIWIIFLLLNEGWFEGLTETIRMHISSNIVLKILYEYNVFIK